MRPPTTLAVAEALGDLKEVCPMWSSVAGSSLVLFWPGKTEAKTSLEGGNSASALPTFWEWGSGSRVPVKNILGCRELSGLLGGTIVLLASLSANLKMGSWVDLGKVAGPSSRENRL